MKETIFGSLIGVGLLTIGFAYHDVDYGPTFFEQDGIQVGPRTYIMAWPSVDTQEELAFTVGMTGSVILTSSLKDAWDRRKPEKKEVGRLRKVLDLAVGFGCLAAGAKLNDTAWDKDSDRWIKVEVPHYPDRNIWRITQKAENLEEHVGFFLGTVGTAWTTIAVKQILGGRYSVSAGPELLKLRVNIQ